MSMNARQWELSLGVEKGQAQDKDLNLRRAHTLFFPAKCGIASKQICQKALLFKISSGEQGSYGEQWIQAKRKYGKKRQDRTRLGTSKSA